MDPDITLITGLALALLAIPSIMAAWIERRSPVVGGGLLLLSGGLVFYAVSVLGVPLMEAPDAFYRIVGRILL